MTEIIDTAVALRTALTGASGITNIVSTRIYGGYARPGTTYPYLIYYKVSGGHINQTPTDDLDDLFRVESRDTNPVTCSALHRKVEEALHKATLTMTGWTNYWTDVSSEQEFTEHIEGEAVVWRKVWDVRIKASKD